MSKARNLSAVPNQSFAMKNRIINGAMVIDQRNAGASVTPTGASYTLDRWSLFPTQASKLSVQQSTTTTTGFTNSTLITSLSAYSVGSGDFFAYGQRIEGYNVADLGWGTADAKTVTLSFWVRSSLTGTFGGSLVNSAATRSYPFTYTISSANTWEQKSVTIVGDTSGTWVTNNGIGIALYFGLGVGSTYSGTAGSWSGNYYFSATGATSVVGTNGATFYITGVQLEVGSSATSFDYRPYGTELALCQRYYYKQTANSPYTGFSTYAPAASATIVEMQIPVKVSMRTYPTTLDTSGICAQDATNIFSTGTFTLNNQIYSTEIVGVRYTHGTSALTQYRPYAISANNNSSAYIGLGAEL